MADIVITGGGFTGLTTALLLAKDGHAVTVLERDEAAPPEGAPDAWEGWTRRGVNQFRLLHFFQPRVRQILEAELPEVVAELEAAGALRFNPIEAIPAEITGGWREGDGEFEALTARRPVFEAALAKAVAASTVTVRRGAPVAGLLAGSSVADGVPHVTGIRLDSGEEIAADLVVEATGRRSPLPVWLEAIGARPPAEELEDMGFQYYGRHFRARDGVSLPPLLGGALTPYGSISILTLLADNGTWGIGLITSAKDKAMRGLRDVDAWTRVVASLPLQAHWLDGEPIDDDIAVIAKIEDRHRAFVVDGQPVATGVAAIGDSWACTNPSVGRGTALASMHALALRDTVRDVGLDDPMALAKAWDDATGATVEPWYRATLDFDRSRLRDISRAIDGQPDDTNDPAWELTRALMDAGPKDPDVLRGFFHIVGVTRLADEIFAEPGILEKVIALGAGWRDAPTLGPTRSELLAAVAG
jgi:2-polyprenyl-6-methoxyphenol hydroxylase-like FAD-dependent oxidoreductase